jgi:hypothetical protein
VLELNRELETLTSRVAELAVAAEAIATEQVGARQQTAAGGRSQSQRPPRSRIEEITVTVRPLPELAMAAMAETSLRGLPGVKQVVSVERFEDWARFTLEVVRGTDLISEIRSALPVAFRSEQSESAGITLDLKWAWGTVE